MEIPDSYPDKLTDEKLREVISKCSEITVNATKINSNYSLGPAYYNSMANLGITEMNKRIQEKLLNELEIQRKNNSKSQMTNRILTFVTILLAIVTLYIGSESLNFAESDMNSDTIWQNEQIELLKNSTDNLQKIYKEISETKNDSIKENQQK